MVEVVLRPGPNAPKKSFRIMDRDGPRNGRDNAIITNGAMQGKLNCINEVFAAVADIPTNATYFRIYDSRVSEQSVIAISPRSLSATLFFVGGQAQGYFDLFGDTGAVADIKAAGSMREPETVYAVTTTPQKIAFDTVGALPLKLMTFANNELTMQMSGLYRFYLRIEGTLFANNRVYSFDFTVTRAGGGTDNYVFDFNSGSNATLSQFFSGTLDLEEGDSVALYVYQDAASSSPVLYLNFELERTDNSPTYDNALPEEVLDDIVLKYAVIG